MEMTWTKAFKIARRKSMLLPAGTIISASTSNDGLVRYEKNGSVWMEYSILLAQALKITGPMKS